MSNFLSLLSFLILPFTACSTGQVVVTQETISRTVRVAVVVPNPCWRITITEVYLTSDEIWVISELKAPEKGTVCIQLIGTIHHEISLELPAFPIKHFVLGRTWTREYGEAQREPGSVYVSPGSRKEIDEMLKQAKRIFPKDE